MKGNVKRTTLQTKPYALRRDKGQEFRTSEAQVYVKATSEQTEGAFNLFEFYCRPGYATSLHIHYAEDVAIYVLEGALTFFWGCEKKQAVAGSYFFQPRGTPHGFRVEGVAPARILYLSLPAGAEQFVIEQELLAPNFESVAEAARVKIEILGPLPE